MQPGQLVPAPTSRQRSAHGRWPEEARLDDVRRIRLSYLSTTCSTAAEHMHCNVHFVSQMDKGQAAWNAANKRAAASCTPGDCSERGELHARRQGLHCLQQNICSCDQGSSAASAVHLLRSEAAIVTSRLQQARSGIPEVMAPAAICVADMCASMPCLSSASCCLQVGTRCSRALKLVLLW